ncbi:MAG: TRAM domain-containing protein [Negativicutes bacterium]|nr:TRAM domain-containing protein [Negativicutes bacterium]
MQRLLRVVIVCLAAVTGFALSEEIEGCFIGYVDNALLKTSFFGLTLAALVGVVGGAMVGAVIGFLVSPLVSSWLVGVERWAEERLFRMSLNDLLAMFVGLAAGLLIANLVTEALVPVPVIGKYLPIFINILLGYIGVRVAVRKRDDLLNMLGRVPGRLRRRREGDGGRDIVGCRPALLDTSAIIDGRIADVARAGFLPGEMVVPGFVISELQSVADAGDGVKRARGRRGLDVLAEMQGNAGLTVQIVATDYPGIDGVDGKLVQLALDLGANLVTTDYNLNKVAALRGIKVLNVNELANALKPVMLPGEEMTVRVLKEGKEHGQGIGYLDDGTMVVVEGGRRLIDREVRVVVNSVIQTAAGRMIFTRLPG